MRKLRLSVCKKLHKCLDSDGDWDGYNTEEAARIAGEMRLNELNKRYESKS